MTDTKLTDLPQAPTEWEPTPHLRWFKAKSVLSATVEVVEMVLQQKWVEVGMFNPPGDAPGTIIPSQFVRCPTGKEEWRTVPTEDA